MILVVMQQLTDRVKYEPEFFAIGLANLEKMGGTELRQMGPLVAVTEWKSLPTTPPAPQPARSLAGSRIHDRSDCRRRNRLVFLPVSSCQEMKIF